MSVVVIDDEERFSTLTRKGYGYTQGANDTASMAMSYGNVLAGSAPAAGDLVCWMVLGFDSAAQCIDDLSGSGWTQDRVYADSQNAVSMLAKVVDAADLSSPPNLVTSPTNGSAGMWVAYTINGPVSITVNSLSTQHSSGGAPSNDVLDSTALATGEYAITMGFGTGTDTAIGLTWTGFGPDVDFQRDNFLAVGATGGTVDIRWMANHFDGGQTVTLSKADDGNWNSIGSGYFSIVAA